jgi:predicted TPR repeat methyltransferase
MRRLALIALLFAAAGCAEKRMLMDLGNGTKVPAESVAAYAARNGLTRNQAKREMLIKAEERKSAEAIAQAQREDNIELGPSLTP